MERLEPESLVRRFSLYLWSPLLNNRNKCL